MKTLAIVSVNLAFCVAVGWKVFGAAAAAPVPASAIAYASAVPVNCPPGSPQLLIQKTSTGLVAFHSCDAGKYKQFWRAPRFIDNETPAGVVDGKNTHFTLAHAPAPPESIEITMRGYTLTYPNDVQVIGRDLYLNPNTILPQMDDNLGKPQPFNARYRY
jgi:hypothetical protein